MERENKVESVPQKPKIDTGQYICPACGSRFIKTIQRKSYGGILFGIMSLAIGTGCLLASILGWIPELDGRIFFFCFGAVWLGIGIYIVREPPEEIIEKCPVCKTRLEKRGGTYRIYHPPVDTSGAG